jgi:XRE family aerobic/anaerobic benzoate catabolism transcriptional regulator
VLRAIAQALDSPAADLLGGPAAPSGARAALLDVVAQVPDHSLGELTQLIEARFMPADRSDRAQRIALVGLRGAGKSTLGRMLARQLGWPFIEIDRVVEQDYGASIPDMIEMAGTATFRRHERAALARVIAEHDAAVITTAGGIVSDRESYALLLRRSHTIWIKARPEEHMGRVMAQGDFRPMAANREAMVDLVAILDARGADYARAQAQLDTSGETVEQSFAKLLRMVGDQLGPTAVPRRGTAGGARS